MEKIRDFLLSTLGTVGFFVFYALTLFLIVFPLLMFSMPWWLYLLLAFLVQFILINIPFGVEVLWIAGLFGAINGKQDIFAYIYD